MLTLFLSSSLPDFLICPLIGFGGGVCELFDAVNEAVEVGAVFEEVGEFLEVLQAEGGGEEGGEYHQGLATEEGQWSVELQRQDGGDFQAAANHLLCGAFQEAVALFRG
jgi:hypothetical protein